MAACWEHKGIYPRPLANRRYKGEGSGCSERWPGNFRRWRSVGKADLDGLGRAPAGMGAPAPSGRATDCEARTDSGRDHAGGGREPADGLHLLTGHRDSGGRAGLVQPAWKEARHPAVRRAVAAEFIRRLQAGQFRQARDAQAWIKKRTRQSLSESGVRKILRRLGGKLKVPRKSHAKRERPRPPSSRRNCRHG